MLVIPLNNSFCENVFNTKGKIAQIAGLISVKISPKIVPASAGQELTSVRKNLPRILILSLLREKLSAINGSHLKTLL